jgi:hypothetical protein
MLEAGKRTRRKTACSRSCCQKENENENMMGLRTRTGTGQRWEQEREWKLERYENGNKNETGNVGNSKVRRIKNMNENHGVREERNGNGNDDFCVLPTLVIRKLVAFFSIFTREILVSTSK